MDRLIRLEFGPVVVCDAANDIAYTRVLGGKAFCGNCGATDHEVAS